jgi:hypothetical protein
MTSDTINDELSRTFDLAALLREAGTLRTPRQWKAASALKRRCQSARTRENDLYVTRYDARVEVERRRLIDAAGTIARDLKPAWAGEDRFSPDITARQAERQVRQRHHDRIARIDEFERRKLREVVLTSMRENNRHGEAREAFARVSERRGGPERRRGRPRDRE